MKISSGLKNNPMKPSRKATPWPTAAATSVARIWPMRIANSARSPPGAPPKPRHAADRQQGDVGGRDPEGARREDVAEFMGEHAGEQQHHEEEAGPGLVGAARGQSC